MLATRGKETNRLTMGEEEADCEWEGYGGSIKQGTESDGRWSLAPRDGKRKGDG